MEKCRLASFPGPPQLHLLPLERGGAAPQEELDTNLSKERASRRLRSGFIVCPSATLLPSSPLSKLHRCRALSRTDAKTNPEGRMGMEERTCVLFPLLCPSGHQTFHLTSAAATTVQRQEEPINCPFLFGLSSHFYSASDAHCSARLTNVNLKRKNCCCCKETPARLWH